LATQELQAEDPLVRGAAVSVVGAADPVTRARLLAPLLTDPSRLVRIDVARALAGEAEAQLPADQKSHFEAAISDYVTAQRHNAERPEAQAALATLAWDRGRLDDARLAFHTALQLDPSFVAAAISLADLERSSGNENAAEEILRSTLAANPDAGPLQHALGLSLIRQKQTAEAMPLLEKAAKNAPDNPRFGYVLAVALHDTGKSAEAREVLKATLLRHPYDREALMALLSYAMEAQSYGDALDAAQQLVRLEPDRPEFARLVEQLTKRAR
jgi:Flp pilus assembly protein TadD